MKCQGRRRLFHGEFGVLSPSMCCFPIDACEKHYPLAKSEIGSGSRPRTTAAPSHERVGAERVRRAAASAKIEKRLLLRQRSEGPVQQCET
ncbi:hypothetical protein EVAR_8935_1 [Eumeta japonica]|uniref:Uncharacterized protein n=1 Tax=Eumeta variegata TaxID=151549 RepID=A0A4C1U0C1_EUMVA|nr:hypothetical protein EVAR_8935_1 [Eumeta japonica]